ncbi:unnamed protein product, partial [Mesorhabditis belari]|uniref:Solute carrier family 35 member F5 n=1 Tax=Mesorhabditis belari TaxID=2138241 RepID=A0AAF3EV67_9BILA
MPSPSAEEPDLVFRGAEDQPQQRTKMSRRMIGLLLLFFVNILWVLSSELLRYIFIEEGFKRPFFVSWLKNCMLSVYLLRYLFSNGNPERPSEKAYKILMEDLDENSLTTEGFETMTSSDNDSAIEENRSTTRSVRFAPHREVRRMPDGEANEARAARRPFDPTECTISCSWTIQRHIRWTLLFFAPMWLVCSFTFQTALAFTSVADLNLISSSSSLFVLVFAICIPVEGQRFTLLKAFLVGLNLAGVALVSEYSMPFWGAIFAQISAISYALYLTAYARYQWKYGTLNIDLMFGTIGLMAVLVGSPMLFVMDSLKIEPLYPLPNGTQVGSILVAGVFGTMLADYLWLLGAGMTDSLSASLSMTLSIPFSFIADAGLRGKTPSAIELIAALPIVISFIGAALLEGRGREIVSRIQRDHGDQMGDTETLLVEEELEDGI